MTGKTACVILNYNDCKNTIELVNSIESYEAFDCIIVVDNCSTDDSLQKLEAVKNGKVIVCSSGKNGGYGYGNNFGVRLAKEKYACKYAVVASPDVRFPEDSVCATINCFENFSKCVVSTPVQITVNDNIYEATAWKLPTKSVYIISAVWPLNKLFKIKNIRIKEKYTRADCIMGSFIAVNIDKFLSFGGFDENIFLYCEETALGYRVKNAGLEEYVVKDKYYKHFHGTGSTYINISNGVKRRKLLLKNRLYIIKEYMNGSKLAILAAKICFDVAIAQEYLKNIIRKFLKR